MSTRVALIVVGGIFLVVFASQIANRMTTDAINVAVGVLCGMAASVPVSFGLLLALQKRQQQNLEETAPANDSPQTVIPESPYSQSPFAPYPQQRLPYPQVIVVAPPQNGYTNPYVPTPGNLPYPQLGDGMQERNWKIVGEEGE